MVKRIDIPVLVALIIIAALLRGEYVELGHWTVVGVIAFFLVSKVVSLLRNYRYFRTFPKMKRTFYYVYLGFIALLLVDMVYTHSVRYFILVTMLLVDYFYSTDPKYAGGDEK